MYKVVKHFRDLQDNNHAYNIGDEYPRRGLSVLPSRIKELASDKNRQNTALIVEVEETKAKKSAKADKE